MKTLDKAYILKNPPKKLVVELDIPDHVDSMASLSVYFFKKYHIDVCMLYDHKGELYMEPTFTYSDVIPEFFIGNVVEFNIGDYVVLEIEASKFAKHRPKEWRELIRDGTIIDTEPRFYDT